MTKIREEYTNLSTEEIFEIFKKMIETAKEFELHFKDDNAKIGISITYNCDKRSYMLNVAKIVNDKIVDVKYGLINIPDEHIHGDGSLEIFSPNNREVRIGAIGNIIVIYRYSNMLIFIGHKHS
jgi:hypothetical protein